MLVDLYKNNNTASKTYGQYYGRVFPRDGLNLKGFARHLSEHGKLASYEMLVLVLQNIVDCMRHLLLEGVPIKLDGLGTFRAGIEGSGADSVEDYRTDQNIKGIRINFLLVANKIRGKEQMFLDRLRSLFPFYCCSHGKGDCFANQSDI